MNMEPDDPFNEVGESTLTSEHVMRRVDDWLARLNALFGTIKIWCNANGWIATDGAIPLHEEMMVRFGIAPRQQPTLSLQSPGEANVFIKPKGLWVIGANGRIDFYSPKGAFTLVDTADRFKPANWTLRRIGTLEGKPFDASQIADMV